MTDNDRIKQANYEEWLNSTSVKLSNQLKYYETEKSKIQKAKKVSFYFFFLLLFVYGLFILCFFYYFENEIRRQMVVNVQLQNQVDL